ncbi:DUF2922 domain-containing protein [Clostridium grantii]|uniref:DUF2922 domain-containing protein n=1 Tax=Clostridium grantii DSM 8605 TaxID=1121316 RepID=A0A1M5RDW1_9CLOT|nr:DUF2922 domain-containing protein [Clostridium grantii]SHH24378.1 Protein of unknown function [Clostridium grantii DSM 8605]
MKKLIMKFKDAAGATKSMTITDVKDGLTQASAEALMDVIITKNVFALGPDNLTLKEAASIVETTETELFDIEA